MTTAPTSSGSGSSDDSGSSGGGANVAQSTTNTSSANGSTTTTITYADGSSVSITTPPAADSASASSSAASSSGGANVANNNLLERLIQIQAQLLNPPPPKAWSRPSSILMPDTGLAAARRREHTIAGTRSGGSVARTDVIVLGAGIVGTSIALHLVKRGLAVALVDRGGAGRGHLLWQCRHHRRQYHVSAGVSVGLGRAYSHRAQALAGSQLSSDVSAAGCAVARSRFAPRRSRRG